jgi:hypothetical protein
MHKKFKTTGKGSAVFLGFTMSFNLQLFLGAFVQKSKSEL